MPLLPPSSLNSSVSLKSLTLPSFQTRNVLFLSGTSFVCPTIAPFSTLQTRASPSQPVRSWPLNSSFASFAAAELTTNIIATSTQMKLRYIEVSSMCKFGPGVPTVHDDQCTTSHKVNGRMAACKRRRTANKSSLCDGLLGAQRIASRNSAQSDEADYVREHLQPI